MKSKQTGPITALGKKVSSKNAIKHGATSPKLINRDEQTRYENLVAALNDQYKSSNPLIQLQITRIARLTIQLERIQNVIDATFRKSRMRDNTGTKLIEFFTRSGTLVEEVAGRLFDAKSHKELEASKSIAFELINADANEIAEISSTEEFIKTLPLLSEYLHKKEKFNNLSIRRFLLEEIAKFSDMHREFSRSSAELEGIKGKSKTHRSDESFSNLNLDLLKIFAVSHKALLSEILISPEASLSIKDSLKIEEEAAVPDGPEMDRLIRYQTTIQRQLSAAIGELLAIKKMDQSF
jgi:hypothetical protein